MRKAANSRVQICLILAFGMLLQSFLSFSLRQSAELQFQLRHIDDSDQLARPTTVLCRDAKTENEATATIRTNENMMTPCYNEMLKILKRQHCFQLQAHAGSSSLISANDFTYCHNISGSVQQMPFHNFAAFEGQGFGRIVEQTVLGCMFATVVLERPCTIDLDVRDPYWTWRSFLNHGSFDWDWKNAFSSDGGSARDQAFLEIDKALGKLKNIGDNQWDASMFQDGVADLVELNQSLVLPMVWNKDWGLEQHLEHWRHETTSSSSSSSMKPRGYHQQKVLLSPNWGNAWFQHVPVASLIAKKTNSKCKLNQLRTYLQNAMYAPTSLSRHLHDQRTQRMFQGGNSSYPARKEPKYGAIHLRTILSDVNIRRSYSTPESVRALAKCLNKALAHLTTSSKTTISHWWLVADNKTDAQYVNRILSGNQSQIPVLVDLDPHFWKKEGTHSGYAMKQKYFHSKMDASMMDFMVLHESQVAVVSHGSFGSTGARGNEKVKVQTCAPNKLFSVFAVQNDRRMDTK